MVMRYGMNATLGQVTYDVERPAFLGQPEAYFPSPRRYSEQTAREIDEAVRQLINTAFAKATDILESHRPMLDETAAKLLVRETLTADELPSIEPIVEIDQGGRGAVGPPLAATKV